jgi:hypothetical protein
MCPGITIINALGLGHDLIVEGYSPHSSYVDEGEHAKDNRIKAKDGCFRRLDRLRVRGSI